MADLTQISQALQALDSKQVRILTGSVTGTSTNSNTIPVRLDNDGTDSNVVPIVIPSIIGLIEVGARVSIIVIPPAGMMIVGVIGAAYDLSNVLLVPAIYNDLLLRASNPVWKDRHFYTANDTWNKPTSALFLGVEVALQAGGGASGGTAAATAAQTTCSGGGQGGGYMSVIILATNLTATVAVTVGAGGTVGAAGANAGNTGGTSSFAAYAAVSGGEGGSGGGAAAAGQTTQNGGDNNQFSTLVVAGGAVLLDFQQGDDGLQGFRYADQIIMPGSGGGSRMGGITRVGQLTTGQIPPTAGWPFGGGASGRGFNGVAAGGGVVAQQGAAGGQGCVVVSEIYRT